MSLIHFDLTEIRNSLARGTLNSEITKSQVQEMVLPLFKRVLTLWLSVTQHCWLPAGFLEPFYAPSLYVLCTRKK